VLAAPEVLRLAGLDDEVGRRHDLLRAGLARLARLLKERDAGTVGLVPAGAEVAVPVVAFELARFVVELRDVPVGVVDAAGTWGCAEALAAEADADEEGAPFVTAWLDGQLALLSQRRPGPPTALAHLRDILFRVPEGPDLLVVDLTGLDRRGELTAAATLLDASVVVARAGRSTAGQVRRALAAVPDGRNLGVLLVGV
jgi:hypothetical protein